MNTRHGYSRRSASLLTAIVAALLPCAAAHAQAAVSNSNERAVTDRYLTTVHAELTGKIDSSTAKAGQGVSVRLLSDVRLADGTTLPKGSRLLGTIVSAQAQSAQQPRAVLALAFDRADIQGRILLVRSVVQMVSAANAPRSGKADRSEANTGRMDASPFPADDDSGIIPASQSGGSFPLGTAGAGTRSSIDPAGAGPMGNGNTPVVVTNQGNVPMPGQQGGVYGGDPGMDSPLGGVPITSRTRDDLGVVAAAPRSVRPVVSAGENVSGGSRATGVPGVMLSRSGAADGSGVLSAMGHNIVLESGTRITLGVISR